MGMDLIPIKPTPDARRYPPGEACAGHIMCLHYNWLNWEWLFDHLDKWGVDTSTFSFYNEGEVIPADVCRAVASAIQSNLSELDEGARQWIRPQIGLWQTCGGYAQW